MMDKIQITSKSALERKLFREREARKEAERLLELKSLELYEANQQLHVALKHLEVKSEASLKKMAFKEHVDEVLIEFGAQFLSTPFSDILLTRFIEKLLDSVMIQSVALVFDQNIIEEGKIPQLKRSAFGTVELRSHISPQRQTRWREGRLTLPILFDDEWIGGWAFQMHSTELDRDFVINQMSLVTDLIKSALSRQRMTEHQIVLRKRAEESERATREFVAMINHELRTPLIGVLGSAELLEKTSLSVEQQEYLTNLRYGGELLRIIINDLLDYSKMNAGLLEVVPKVFSWQSVEEAMVGIFTSKARSKSIDFVVTRKTPIPTQLLADAERLKQVLVNVLGNAFKFTHHGQVSMVSEWHRDQLTITVQDSGIGIPQSAMDKLFEPFIQVDRTTTRRYEGSGLGLAICHKLTALMNGSIHCESSLNEGSVFTIIVPAPVARETVQTDKRVGHCANNPITLSEVLVVDDIKMNQMIASQMLKKIGIKPDVRGDGCEALEAVASKHYDLIFMDCRMPIMDGYQATQQLRAEGVMTPIIALTAGTTIEEREKCLASGMNDILTKPYTVQDIKHVLMKWIKKS